jgi:hypothetical protein
MPVQYAEGVVAGQEAVAAEPVAAEALMHLAALEVGHEGAEAEVVVLEPVECAVALAPGPLLPKVKTWLL